jgi:hypothetical protein
VINTVSAKTINSIDLFWSKYEGDDFERYEVYYKHVDDIQYVLYATIKNERQIYITVSSLKPKTKYQFYVKTIDQRGQYAVSTVFQNETLSDIPSPVYFNPIPDSEISYHTIRVTWSPYRDDFAVPFSRYEVYCSSSRDFPITGATKTVIVNNKFPAAMLVDLTEFTRYYFKVRTYNTLGKYAESATMFEWTTPCPPAILSLFEPTEVTISSAKLNWTKSSDTGFIRYEVHLTNYPEIFPDSSNLVASFFSRDNTEYQLTNLVKYGEYFAKIVEFKNNGTHSVSNYVAFTAYPGGGAVPVQIYTPTDENISINSVYLSWTKSSSRFFMKYEIDTSTVQGFTPNNLTIATSIPLISTTGTGISKLRRNTTYYFKVVVITSVMKPVTSAECKVTTKP